MSVAAGLCPDDVLTAAALRALAPGALGHAFAKAAPGLRIAGASIERTKYKPSDKVLLSVRLHLHDEIDRLFAVRVMAPGKAPARYRRACAETSVAGSVLLLEDVEAVAWAFPHDLKVKTLPYLADPELFQQFVLPDLAQRAAPGASVEAWSSEIAHYAAEQSCAMRVGLRLCLPNGKRVERTFYGKCHAEGETGQAALALGQIEAWLCAARKPSFGVAAIILEQRQYAIQWQDAATGAPIEPGKLFTGNGELLARIGAAVAQLHQAPLSASLFACAPDLVKLRRRLAVAAALPMAARRDIEMLLARLGRTAPRPPLQDELCVTHGDLHPKNIFDDGARVTFIDFDAAHLAPAEQDVASFSAALIYHGALEGLQDDVIATLIERWQAAYEAAACKPLNTDRLAWLTAFCLLDERLYRCLTRLKPGRREIADRLLVWANKAMREDRPQRRVHRA